jgi:hypothetical protein
MTQQPILATVDRGDSVIVATLPLDATRRRCVIGQWGEGRRSQPAMDSPVGLGR